MQIRPANPSDIPQLVAISESAASAARWTPRQWLDIFGSQISGSQVPSRLALLALAPAVEAPAVEASAVETPPFQPIGFLVAQCAAPDWELENIAVLPVFRRRGAAAALLSALLAQARACHAGRILLEVRLSNRAAIRLYRQAGFQPLARRPAYYHNPSEDALILVHPL